MASKPIIWMDRGRPTGEARLRSHRAHCPDCTYVAEHKFSATAAGLAAEHGEKGHGWTERPQVRERR